jgi:cellulose synthase/poly-beta-1,6-N-acetylglucosamine synthase-like glycosyltransferase
MSGQRAVTTSQDKPIASVIIPAFNEEVVIERTLKFILANAAPGELEVIVVCNGCRDQTAEVAKGFGDRVQVVEVDEASKTNALNIGNELARAYPRVFLDADVRLSIKSLRRLVWALNDSEKMLAAGRMEIDQSRCDRWVQAFHRVWQLQPYFDQGKVGGVFALSREGWGRINELPSVTADDEFVRRFFSSAETVFEDDCCFTVDAPRTLKSLLQVKSRVRRGNIELAVWKEALESPSRGSHLLFLRRIISRPSVWLSVPTYCVIVIAADLLARLAIVQKKNDWSRDTTTRTANDVSSGNLA